jgi:hypothetical protein
VWRPTKNKDTSRGGFQNRDVGRSNLSRDFGPDFGPDYARYSDPPDFAADNELREQVKVKLEKVIKDSINSEGIRVRNGFVFLEGEVFDEDTKRAITDAVRTISGVRDVINQLKVTRLQ